MWHGQIRWKVIEARFEGQHFKGDDGVALRFGVGVRSCFRWWRAFKKNGSPWQGARGRRKMRRAMLDALDEQVLAEMIDKNASLYLDELALNLSASLGRKITIANVLVALKVLALMLFCYKSRDLEQSSSSSSFEWQVSKTSSFSFSIVFLITFLTSCIFSDFA
jgi:transposase